jgi:Bacterial Ig-like domain
MWTPLLMSMAAWANGQTTHLWITGEAVGHLPDGELRELLEAEVDALRSGTMFPDGGYSPVQDAYGELAHWEPFQDALLDAIRDQYGGPWDSPADLPAEARPIVAFWFGLASHGMADQTFDAMYMERARQEDIDSDWANLSMDEATDVVFASLEGPQALPEQQVPYDLIAALMASEAGHSVSVDTMQDGQWYLEIAVTWVGTASEDPLRVASYADQFPWATDHLLDEAQVGSPPCQGEINALYWQELWRRLSAEAAWDAPSPPIIAAFPSDGTTELTTAADQVQSRIAVVFAAGLDGALFEPSWFVVTDASGAVVETDSDLFYGNGSHVVLVSPKADWEDDADYLLTVHAGVEGLHTTLLDADWPISFSTRTPVIAAAEAAGAADGCGCASRPGAWQFWLPLLAGLAAARRTLR